TELPAREQMVRLLISKLKFRKRRRTRGKRYDGFDCPGQIPDIIEKGHAFLWPSDCTSFPLSCAACM
ncbi:MAG TPA: hypothetical protein PKN77_07065, partial [Caldisericia bacterium]|nr:hypothetical protein [Caldisericia bacterium]